MSCYLLLFTLRALAIGFASAASSRRVPHVIDDTGNLHRCIRRYSRYAQLLLLTGAAPSSSPLRLGAKQGTQAPPNSGPPGGLLTLRMYV